MTSVQMVCLNLPGIILLEIGFINGIGNNIKGSRKGAEHILKLAGGYNVHTVYNATHGEMDLPERCNGTQLHRY